MIKSIGDNYRIYDLIIVKTILKKSLVLDYGFSNATFETPNHAFIHIETLYAFIYISFPFLLNIMHNTFQQGLWMHCICPFL